MGKKISHIQVKTLKQACKYLRNILLFFLRNNEKFLKHCVIMSHSKDIYPKQPSFQDSFMGFVYNAIAVCLQLQS